MSMSISVSVSTMSISVSIPIYVFIYVYFSLLSILQSGPSIIYSYIYIYTHIRTHLSGILEIMLNDSKLHSDGRVWLFNSVLSSVGGAAV